MHRRSVLPWISDPEKDEINRRKHGLPLAVGAAVMDDPLLLSRPDEHPDGDRWFSIGVLNGVAVAVIRTWPDDDDINGRVISVRQATNKERKAYEDGD
jgi:uncharacterized DUF497 family protein